MRNKKDNTGAASFRANKTGSPDSDQIRDQADQKARAIKPPALDAMTREEAQHMFIEMQVKQLEMELKVDQLQNRLEEADEQAVLFKTFSENMLDMIVLTDIEGKIKFIGKSVETIGYRPDFLFGKNVMDFVHPEDLPHVSEAYQKLVASGTPRRIEYRCRCKDGSYLWIETRGVIIKENNNKQGIVFNSRDITERKQAEEALRESEQKFKQWFESSPISLWEQDFSVVKKRIDEIKTRNVGDLNSYFRQRPELGWELAGMVRVLDVNQATLELYRAKSKEDFYDGMTKVFSEESLEGFLPLLEVIAAREKTFITEKNHVTLEGEPLKVQLYWRVAKGHEKTYSRILVSIVDITQRKRAEEALRQSENYHRAIFETSATAILVLEEDTTLSHVNSNFEKLLGYSKQEVEGKKSWTEFIHPGDVEWMKENHYLRRRDPRAAPLNYEFRFFVRNGELRNGYLTIDMIPGTTRSVVSLIDITERKHAEQQLAESEERFSKAFRSSPAPHVISDITTGEFIDVNDRWVDMLGYAREQSIGRTSKDVGIWADPGQRDRIIQELQENTFFNEEPVEFRTSNGSTVYALWSAERITLKGRRVMLSMIYDETERKHAEKEQKKLQAQLAQAQKLESVGRLAGGVAHDFNNKLSIINGYAELTLEMLEPEEPAFENLREIYSAGKRSANIVRQLLAFARQQTISPVRLDLNDTISNMLKMLQRLIGENIDLVWHPGTNLWQIKIDPSQIDQIMANLAVNARDAIEDIGRLIIETKNVVVDEDHCRQYSYFVPGRYVILAVSDTGCGMEKEVQDNLFEPFFTTKGVGMGTGLGMSTIYGIVKQNKGFINVYSEPGQGTTFKIYLPPDEEKESDSSQHLKESAKQMPTGSETVLLVEDEPAILKMGRGLLEKLGYTVVTAEKPDDALRFAEEYEGKIHLLITDVIMPEMNGCDLAAKLSECSPGLKSIYMSGYTADVIAHHGVLEKGVHFIQKPFSIQDLAVKVRKAIEQA
ncbi:MAG: PAS domain S-box protein [Thermodesulfobacteriota bacterium]